MLVEQRTYTLHPGQTATFLDAYRGGVCDLQVRVLGTMIGYFTTEIGPLNQVVHLWGYESLDERLRRRKALFEAPEWQAFLRKVLPLIVTMENKILIPTAFSPIR
jgi:NIPSNAP